MSLSTKTIGILFTWFVLVLGVFHSAHLYSNDALLKIRSAQNLLKTGDTSVRPTDGGWGSRGREGRMYPNFSLGSILVMVPAVLVAEGLSIVVDENYHQPLLSAVVSTQNLLITAAAMTVVFLILHQTGMRIKKSFLSAMILLFSTQIISYSSTGWNEPTALLFALTAFYFLINIVNSGSAWIAFSACMFVAVTIRIEYSVYFLIFILLMGGIKGFGKEMVVYGALALVLCATVHLAYNHYRFESLLDFGYLGGSESFETKKATLTTLKNAISALNFTDSTKFKLLYTSFGRLHPFWAAPLLAAVPFFLKGITRIHPVLYTCFLSALLFFPFIRINSWCWANRYIYIFIPFLLIPLAYGKPLSRRAHSVLFALALVGVCVSLSGKLINYHVVLENQVRQHGYGKVMFSRSQSFLHAPFWDHAKRIPGAAISTIQLPFGKTGEIGWEQLRKDYFDIWPVGLVAVGVRPTIAFAFWLFWIACTYGFFRFVVKKYVLQEGTA